MKSLKNALKYTVCVVSAVSLVFSLAGCSKPQQMKASELPLVYADGSTLKYIPDDSLEAVEVTEKFNPGYGNIVRAKVSADGNTLYYIESSSEGSLLGTLFKVDISKTGEDPVKLHENVYSFDFSADESVVVIMEGSGKLIKYDKKSEKSGEYDTIEDSLVSEIIRLSTNGKYVLYKKVLPGNSGVYSTCLAKTDFKQTDKTRDMTADDMLKNTNVSEAPVVINESNAALVFANDDLSYIYLSSKGDSDFNTLSLFKGYKENTVITDRLSEVLSVDASGNMLYTESVKGGQSVSDIVTDTYEKKDAKLKKPDSSDSEAVKAYEQKQKRDKIRSTLESYLSNFTQTTVYSLKAKTAEGSKICSFNGQIYNVGNDDDDNLAFFSVNDYDFESEEDRVKLEEIKSPYEEVFSPVRSQYTVMVGAGGAVKFEPSKNAAFNGAQVFVDTQNNRISALFDYDFSAGSGTLYTADYSVKGFGEAQSTQSVNGLLEINSVDTVYYTKPDGSAYAGETKLEISSDVITPENPAIPVFMEDNAKGAYTLYSVSGSSLTKLGTGVNSFVIKGDSFVYYSKYDAISREITAHYYKDGETVDLGKSVVYVMSY